MMTPRAAGILPRQWPGGHSPHEVALPGTLIGPGVLPGPQLRNWPPLATAEVDVVGHGQLDRHARPTVGQHSESLRGGRSLFPRLIGWAARAAMRSVTERPVGGSDPAAAQ